MATNLEPVVDSGSGLTDEELLTPPTSPRPDQYGSLTSPVSPAHSLTSPQQDGPGNKPKRRRPIPFLFRMLRKKKKNKKVAAAAKAGLAPPGLDDSPNEQAEMPPIQEVPEEDESYDVLGETGPEPKIDWLENKGEKKKKKAKSGIFKLSRGKKVSCLPARSSVFLTSTAPVSNFHFSALLSYFCFDRLKENMI